MSLPRLSQKHILAFVMLLGSGIWISEARADSIENGRRLFAKCRACHALEKGKDGVGPSLYGIIGRPSASEPGFKYSQPMSDRKITWTRANLSDYLRDPKSFIPGNKMVFPGIRKSEDVEALLDYLAEATK